MAIFLALTSCLFAFVTRRAWHLKMYGMFGLGLGLLISSVGWHGTKHPMLLLPDKVLAHVCCIYPTIQCLITFNKRDILKSTLHLGSVVYNCVVYYYFNHNGSDMVHATIHIVGVAGALCYLDSVKQQTPTAHL